MNKDIDMRRYYLLALNRVSFLTPRERLSLINIFDDLKDVFNKLSVRDLASVLGRKILSKLWKPEQILQLADKDIKELFSGRINCLFYQDKNYPAQLSEIYDPPVVLFYRGQMFDNKGTIGIVGTRRPTGKARKAAYGLGYELGKLGIYIVSGLALGIDTEAHKGCVSAGGVTLAVLGCGADIIYPGSNTKIARQILNTGGMILSEFPPGTPPLKYNFPCRNRIISGLSDSVVIVQAPGRSGALITADYALDQGRELFVHADGVDDYAGAGTKGLVENGACTIRNYKDLLFGMGYTIPNQDKMSCTYQAEDIGKELAGLMELELSGRIRKRYI